MDVAVIIPALNAAKRIARLMTSIKAQTLQPKEILVIDSNSSDGTGDLATQLGARVLSLGKAKFNHGATRQWALDQTSAEVVIFLTDDAFPADDMAFANLCRALDEVADAGMAYGRQLPSLGASLLAVHHRTFNYPPTSACRRRADIARTGMKTFFASDSFAAYRRSSLRTVGGFAETIFGEDAHVAARMILAGFAVIYAADARVLHSHNYTLGQEFRRHFDVGVFHARNPWLRENFGGPGGEGVRFVKSQIGFLREHSAASLVPRVVLATAVKLLGYRVGLLEAYLPTVAKRRLSMNRGYWTT